MSLLSIMPISLYFSLGLTWPDQFCVLLLVATVLLEPSSQFASELPSLWYPSLRPFAFRTQKSEGPFPGPSFFLSLSLCCDVRVWLALCGSRREVSPRPLVPAFRFSYYLHGQPPTDRQRKTEVHDNQCNAACLLASASFLAFWLLLHAKPPSPLVSSHWSICQAERSFASSRSIST